MRIIKRFANLIPLGLFSFATATIAVASDDVVIVVGAGGTEAFAEQFDQWAANWMRVVEQAGATAHRLGPGGAPAESLPLAADNSGTGDESDRDRLVATLDRLGESDDNSPLWLVLIGHGTFQQGIANFNLRGPDISADALAKTLARAQRPLVVVNCASASGPFLAALSAPDRVVITATRDGDEQNFARFGQYLSEAIGDKSADLDHDDQVSILEAYLMAAAETREFYATAGRLATEHPLMDDNGDGKGTPPEFFHGARVTSEAASGAEPDGRLAIRRILDRSPASTSLSPDQQQRVAEIEAAIDTLRNRKPEMDPDAYYDELETLLVELAELENPLGD